MTRETTCPFPGFRPFEEDEIRFFFGRESATYDILDRLRESSFVAVVGASGSGKSSLVRCGVLPALHRGLLGVGGATWRVATIRPRNDPIGRLAAGLAGTGLWPDDEYAADMIETVLRHSPLGLLDFAEQSAIGPDENLLVFVDQFEELFRFAGELHASSPRRDDVAFVKLLLEAAARTRRDLEEGGRASRPRVFVLLTMRSDFLGDCTPYEALTAWINDGFFLTPLLDRAQRQKAIEGPVAMAGGTIAPRLVSRILNDAGDDPAMLPPLQHGLMRTWLAWGTRTGGVGSGEPLDLLDYPVEGGLEAALDAHLDEILASLGDGRQKIAETVFRRLTETLEDGRQVRRAATVRELALACGLEGEAPAELREVLDAFRREGRTFLTPRDEALGPDTLVDISHESLISSWEVLRNTWMEREHARSRVYRDLSRAAHKWARRQAEGETPSPYTGADLADALEWRRGLGSEKQAAAWAAPYDRRAGRATGFRDATDFLAWSRRKRLERRALGGLLAAAVLALVGWIWNDARLERRDAATRAGIRVAETLRETDPLLAARTLAGLAGRPDPDGSGARLARRLLTEETLPLRTLAGLDSVRALDLAPADGPLLVIGDSAGTPRAVLIDPESGARIERLATGEGLVTGWLEGGAGTLVFGGGRDSVPEGWRGLAIPRGWAGRQGPLRSPGGGFVAALYGTGDERHVCTWGIPSGASADLPPCEAGAVREAGPWRLGLPRARGLAFAGDSALVAWSLARQSDTGALLDAPRVAVLPLDGTPARAVEVPVGTIPGTRSALDEVLVTAYRRVARDTLPDSDLLVAGLRSGAIRLWNLASPDSIPPSCADSLSSTPVALDFLPSRVTAEGVTERLVSVGEDGSVEVWRLDPSRIAADVPCRGSRAGALQPLRRLASGGLPSGLAGARFGPDGFLHAFGRTAGGLDSWRVQDLAGAPVAAGAPWIDLRGGGEPLTLARVAPGRHLLVTAAADGEIRIWDTRGTRWYDSLPAPDATGAVDALAVSRDGAVLAWAAGDTLTLHDRRTGRRDAVPLPGPAARLDLAPDGSRYAVAIGDSVLVGTMSGWVSIAHEDAIVSVRFLDDGVRLLTADRSGGVRLMPTAGGDAIDIRETGSLLAAVGTDAGVVATATGDFLGSTIRLWAPGGGGVRATMRIDDALNRLAFSPDGRFLAVYLSGSIRVYAAGEDDWSEDGIEVVVVDLQDPRIGYAGAVRNVGFVSDSLLVVRHDDAFVIWEIVEGAGADGGAAAVFQFRVREPIRLQALAPGSGEVVTLSEGGALRAWPVRGGWDDLVGRLRRMTTPSGGGDR